MELSRDRQRVVLKRSISDSSSNVECGCDELEGLTDWRFVNWEEREQVSAESRDGVWDVHRNCTRSADCGRWKSGWEKNVADGRRKPGQRMTKFK